MDQNRRGGGGGSRPYQFHPARPLIHDLFNLYLGKNSRQKSDESIREPPNKAQKRVSALNRELPPRNEQFILDFEQLQSQFPDQEQLRAVTESVLTSMVIQCSSHTPRADFLRFALRSLSSIGFIQWDTFLPCLLSSVSSAETSIGQSITSPTVSTSLSQSGNILMPHSTTIIPNSSNFQSASPASPLPSIIGSPSMSGGTDGLSSVNLKLFDGGQQSTVRAKKPVVRNNGGAISSLRKLCCKIILSGLEFNLKPVTHVDIFNHMMNWLVNWGDQRRVDGSGGAERGEWLHICLDVIWVLVDDDKCRVPFYELLRGGLQFIDNIPDDEALFTLILEIHRRRDMMALNMQMLDQHLHCPTFGNQRLLSQATTNVSSGEVVVNMRYSPITYPSVLGEPLHGEELASCIEKGSLDWERAVRCVRHALRVTPSSDWWKRVLLVAPCYRNAGPFAGAVFSCEMICEATIDRIIELLKLTNLVEVNCWQDWLVFSDMFYFLMKNCCIDFVDFVDKLVVRFAEGDQNILRTNHVTWLFAQIIRVELVMTALNTDPRKVETTRKMLSFHKEDRSSDPNNPQSILLDFISSCQNLRIWSLNTTTREYLNNEQLQKGKQIDEWWRQVSKGEHMMDYMNLDDRSIGMFWVVSYTMAQPACETVMNWLTSAGVTELLPVGSNPQMNERMMVMREVSPLPTSLLSGFSINLFTKLAYQMEDAMFFGQVVPNVAMVETYVRLMILSPHSLFRPLLSHLSQKSPTILSKPAATLLVLEILNYRLLPLYRYQGKSKHLMYDITKIVSMFKGKRGEHRIFRLSENLCMNLILSLREFFIVKKEGKGPTEFTETLNRITIMTLAIIIRTRGIAEAEQMLYLPSMLEQILATSQHTWSEKTLRYFPSVLRDALSGRTDRRGLAIQTWQQVESTVIHQCTQLLSPTADPGYAMTYIGHSFPQHRQYLCAGAWTLMHGHPENINIIILGRVLREFSPEEVTANIYTMVDVLLHHIHLELQQGHPLQELILKASANLAYFIWTGELLPLDILLLALIDRDDDPHALRIAVNLLERQELQQRVKFYTNHSPLEHWLFSGMFKRLELQKALGSYLSWKERYPIFFDDIVARLLPVIPLIVYRLIENDAIDLADRILLLYQGFLLHYPFNFTFVRDILAYFYGHLPGKLILRILKVLDLKKIPISESFPQHINSPSNAPSCPPLDYFVTLLLGIVNNVIPPLNNNSSSKSAADTTTNNRTPLNKNSPEPGGSSQKGFYQMQDPGTNTQLVLETAVIEILSLPTSTSQIVSSLVQIIVHIQPMLIQSSNNSGLLHVGNNGSVLPPPTSPSGGGGSSDSMGAGAATRSTTTTPPSRSSGYTCQQLSCLLIQACGLLLAQLPTEFHVQLYLEASRVIKESWWLNTEGGGKKRSLGELDSAVGYALLDPSSAAQDNTSTAIGNTVALLHALFSNLPQEWLEGTHLIINHLRPVTSIAVLRIAFRIMGPLLPRLANTHDMFCKTLSLLLNILVDVFGKNSQVSTPFEASDIADLVDFLHHAIHYEGQGGPVQANSKPRPDVLALCGRALENLRPDIQHLLSHLKTDVNSSIYAASHQS